MVQHADVRDLSVPDRHLHGDISAVASGSACVDAVLPGCAVVIRLRLRGFLRGPCLAGGGGGGRGVLDRPAGEGVLDGAQDAFGAVCRSGDRIDLPGLGLEDAVDHHFCLVEKFRCLSRGAQDLYGRDLFGRHGHLGRDLPAVTPGRPCVDAVLVGPAGILEGGGCRLRRLLGRIWKGRLFRRFGFGLGVRFYLRRLCCRRADPLRDLLQVRNRGWERGPHQQDH